MDYTQSCKWLWINQLDSGLPHQPQQKFLHLNNSRNSITTAQLSLLLCLYYVDLQLDATEIPDICRDIQCLYDDQMNRTFLMVMTHLQMERSRRQGKHMIMGFPANRFLTFSGPRQSNSHDLTLNWSPSTLSQLVTSKQSKGLLILIPMCISSFLCCLFIVLFTL